MARHAARSERARDVRGPDRRVSTMKFFTGCVAAAALALVGTAAEAQVLAAGAARGPYITVSDIDGPYGPPDVPRAPPPRYGYGDERGPAPALLPATEVYAVLRD